MGGGGLGGVALNLSLVNGFIPVVGQQYKIIDNQGPSAVTGKFFGPINEGGTITLNQHYKFSVSYAGGDGNDVVLTVAAVSWPGRPFLDHPATGTYHDSRRHPGEFHGYRPGCQQPVGQ